MSKVAKPLQDDEAVEPLDDDGNPIEFVQKDADDNSTKEAKKAASGFTPTQPVSWPHSRAKPPQEPLSEEEVHGRTRGEHAKTNRVLDSREEAERARRDDHRHDPDGDRARGSIEARWAAGYTKIAGKHVVNPGLLTRDSGRLKVLPESISAEEREKWLGRAIELDEIAKKELHGRNATIFEGRVTDPLLGRGPRRSAKELATKFGIPEKSASINEMMSLNLPNGN
jgi:hypothetical protein